MKLFIHRKFVRWGLCALAILTLVGCEGEMDSFEGESELEGATNDAQKILGGFSVEPEGSPHVMVYNTVWGNLCSGTILNERFVVTAKHCKLNADQTVVIRDNIGGSNFQFLSISAAYEHPSLDIGIVKLTNDMTDVRYQTSMFPWPDSNLVGGHVECYGYGDNDIPSAGMGTLRQSTMYVTKANGTSPVPNTFELGKAIEYNSLASFGDSGGGCFLWGEAHTLVGVMVSTVFDRDGAGNIIDADATYVIPTHLFSRWALPIISLTPSRNLICHGRECITRTKPMPNRVSEEVAWRPCAHELSGPGRYSFDYEISYDFEKYYDSVTVGGIQRDGAGTETGTSSASHLGHRLNVYTDYSVQSPGVDWLRAVCDGDPVTIQ